MKRLNLALLLALILSVMSAVPAFAGPRAPAQTLLPITIGYQSNIDWLLLVAKERQLFEKAGLEPSFVKFDAGPPMIAAAQEKRIDVTTVGTVPFLRGLAQDVDWVAIGINPEGPYGTGLVARNGVIATVADLVGKKVGYVKGSTAHYGIIMALKQLGVRRDQVELLDMAPAEQLAALSSSRIDAAMVWEPWMQKMVHEANGKILITEGDMGNYASVSVLAARRDWLRDNREAAVRFMRALLMAGDLMKMDPEIGIKALAKEMDIKETWADEIYANTPPPKMALWADPRFRYSLVRNSEFHRRLGYLMEFLVDEQVIPQKVDMRNILDVAVIADALKTQAPAKALTP